MDVCVCEALITRPEQSYRLWCVVVCDLETSRMGRPWPALAAAQQIIIIIIISYFGVTEFDTFHRFTPGVRKFSKNLQATVTFDAPEKRLT